MYKITNKLLSALLMLAMVLTLICMSAFAAEVTEVDTADELKTAIAAGENIKLTANIELNELVKIEQAISIDGAGFTITGSAAKVFEVYANANFTNVTIVNTANNGRCVDTRVGNITLTLDSTTLTAEVGTSQPLTIGGDAGENGVITVDIKNNSTVASGTGGYSIITFNPVNMTISDSTIGSDSSYCALYFKKANGSQGSDGSVVTVIGSTLASGNVHSVETNNFSTVIFGDDNITFSADANSTISATRSGDQPQTLLSFIDYDDTVGHSNLNIDVKGTLTQTTQKDSIFFFYDNDSNVVKLNSSYADVLEADGFCVAVNESTATVYPSHTVTEVPAVEATYTAAGNIKYYTCTCGKWFSDAAAQTEITDKDSVVIPQLVEVQDTTASVAPEAVDKAVEEANSSNSDEVVIELTTDEEHKDVTAVELPVASVDKIADANKDLTVSTPEVTVTLDTKTLETIAAAVNRSDATVTLEVVKIETEELNAAQKDAIADLEVAVTISASLIADNTSIHDFNGGNVTVQLPFTPAEGTSGSDYVIYYIADDGTTEKLDTTYVDGQLVFTLTHFSEYVVVNNKATTEPEPEPQPEPETTPSTPSGQDSPATDDFSNPVVLMIAMLLSAFVAATMTYNKKRA